MFPSRYARQHASSKGHVCFRSSPEACTVIVAAAAAGLLCFHRACRRHAKRSCSPKCCESSVTLDDRSLASLRHQGWEVTSGAVSWRIRHIWICSRTEPCLSSTSDLCTQTKKWSMVRVAVVTPHLAGGRFHSHSRSSATSCCCRKCRYINIEAAVSWAQQLQLAKPQPLSWPWAGGFQNKCWR